MDTSRSPYRRTWRTAGAMTIVVLAVLAGTAPSGASPGETTSFDNGTGSAIALGYKVNPTNGNLSFGVTFGESIARLQNTAAIGQSRAVNMGVIGTTLAGEGCDGGDPTWAEEDQPHPVTVRSGDDRAAEGHREFEGGAPNGIEKFARATTAPLAEAITTIAPLGDPSSLLISGGRTTTRAGVVDGAVREAIARTELGEVRIGGGAVVLRGLVWEAVHRSGDVEDATATFTIGSAEVAGTVHTLPGDGTAQAEALDALLQPLGLTVTPPQVRTTQGIVFVDPLTIGVVPSAQRDAVLGRAVGSAQPIRDRIVDALMEQDCGNATYVTIADLVLGAFTGAGELTLELGGVQATTASIEGFAFPSLSRLPPLGQLAGGLGTFAPGTPGSVETGSGTAGSNGEGTSSERAPLQSIAGLQGERGGLLALVAGGGLALLAATAEADRRKMRRALREIPEEH